MVYPLTTGNMMLILFGIIVILSLGFLVMLKNPMKGFPIIIAILIVMITIFANS